jgi:NADH-quinone oxidoreductase subunit I
MRLFGVEIVRGMMITLGRFVATYTESFKRILGRKTGGKRGAGARGIFTIQYPEERAVTPERFRVLPVILYDDETGLVRCTACGICTKVCPPQCIWIVQARGEDGKPRSGPAEFTVETNVCMNCGLCAEFCPFGAIKMDRRFELADRERRGADVMKLEDLMVSSRYYMAQHPEERKKEEEARRAKAAKTA